MPTAPKFRIALADLSLKQVTAFRERARRRGLSPQEYLKEIIAEDARLDAIASSKSFTELAAPFRKALSHLSEPELDALAKPRNRRVAR